MKKFVITYINKDGMRQLLGANHGHRFKNTREQAEDHLKEILMSNSDQKINNVFGEGASTSLEVREVECYESGDAKGIYFDN